MKKISRVLQELSELYEFNKKLREYKFVEEEKRPVKRKTKQKVKQGS